MTEQIIRMPAGTAAQEAGWHGLMDLSIDVPEGWTIVGGQMVHLWCAERGSTVVRPTDDADAVLDVRAHPRIHLAVTTSLKSRGFTPVTSPDGVQHRWENGNAVIDVLIPRHLGAAARSKGAGGGPTIETPGAQKVLDRAEQVRVAVSERTGTVSRPSLIGALVGKSAAYTVILDRNRDRHLGDLVTLATLLRPADITGRAALDRRELELLGNAVGNARLKPTTWAHVPGGEVALDRLAAVITRASRRSGTEPASRLTGASRPAQKPG